MLAWEALYPARQAQWKVEPVLMHDVVTSQLFWPLRGLQVPHFGGVGLARARVVAVRSVRMESCILA